MKRIIFIISCWFCYACYAQPAGTRFFFASKQCRDSVTQHLKQQIDATLNLPFATSNSTSWMSAFWAMELMLYKPAFYAARIPKQIQELPTTDPVFQRSFFEMLYTLYPLEFSKEVKSVWTQIQSDKVKAIALEYLALSNVSVDINEDKTFTKSVYFHPYNYVRNKSSFNLPARKNFLDSSFLPGQTVLCSFQSADRNQPGYLMIRTADGRWLADENGKEFRFPQLARAISNLPFYLTNGNTPQGLYRINGFDFSNNNWIGPTPNLQMCLPFETAANPFFTSNTAFEETYENLLGSGLSGFKTLWESFLAGKLGRTEIIAHGTTINPDYYKSQLYYPNTPSLGCLCSPEEWNDEGQLLFSSQQHWVNVVQQFNPMPNYLLVADILDL